jgi:hypothetical protein
LLKEEPFVMRKMMASAPSPARPTPPPKGKGGIIGGGIGIPPRQQHFDNNFQQRGWPSSNRLSAMDGEEEGEEPMGNWETALAYEGFCIDLLKEMAKLLNFTFEVVEVDDGRYGVEVSILD